MPIALNIIGIVGQFKALSEKRKAARAQKKSQAIAGANEQTRNTIARRAAAKEARRRQAAVLQSSENTGVLGSSGQLGAVSGIEASFSSQVAQQQGNQLAAEGQSAANQEAADALTRAGTAAGVSQIAFGAADMLQDSGKTIFGGG